MNNTSSDKFSSSPQPLVASSIRANLLLNVFALVTQSPKVPCSYGLQIAIENVRSETYSLLILLALIPAVSEQTHLFQAIDTHTHPCV
jgi:hypothetical protein